MLVSVYDQLGKAALNRKTGTCETTSELQSTECKTILLLKMGYLPPDAEEHRRDLNGVSQSCWNVKEVMGMRGRRGSAPSETHGRKQQFSLEKKGRDDVIK